MNLFSQLYNGFLLRDFLGYVLPGGITLVAAAMLISSLRGDPEDLIDLLAMPTDGVLTVVFILCISYACGHAISGLFFHIHRNRIFSHIHPALYGTAARGEWPKVLTEHTLKLRHRLSDAGDPARYQVERFAALVHFTGHVSAAIIVSVVLLLSSYAVSCVGSHLWYAVALAALFPGIWAHYRSVLRQRLSLEQLLIAGVT